MKIELFDTTLRDGTQGEGVNLSVEDKLRIAHLLDDFGIDIIEGGWPGSNPRDKSFFTKAKKETFANAKLCAFGSTARRINSVKTDPNLNALLHADTSVISIFGKTWRFHSSIGLGLEDSENESLIYQSVQFLKDNDRTVIFDAEHFFDGFKDDPSFAISMLKAAESAGADVIALCDTNGGSLTTEISNIVSKVTQVITIPIGIHTHNDGGLGVANTIAAIEKGAYHVQGTINGVGERCGNANLCSIIPNLILKMNLETNKKVDLSRLTYISHYVAELMNLVPDNRAPFVGKSAFAHKGGVHVSAVMKDSSMYEHISPEKVGSEQRVLVSDLSGKSNIRYKIEELDDNLIANENLITQVVKRVKSLEHEGFQFDGAEASFELLLRKETGDFTPFFKIVDSNVHTRYDELGTTISDAVLKASVNGETEHTAAEGVGPVDALDNALRKALSRFYPEIQEVTLLDYKVRVLNEKHGTKSKVRVLIESSDKEESWSTVGVSGNIIEASWQALSDSLNYKLYKTKRKKIDVVT
ncbi:MAG: citramalate synthase [Candidatus Marinimicrobia bacterium]|nr:citramalate synthase [Candidatus Neomarinimicrobiota bacterium]|tara:strand:+ start:2815 stop:4398 length:1584 start_codon:yes stop_codon:yes gene_type:complete